MGMIPDFPDNKYEITPRFSDILKSYVRNRLVITHF